jgi:hypothetical protein
MFHRNIQLKAEEFPCRDDNSKREGGTFGVEVGESRQLT